jgi:putative membrane protein
MGGIFQSLIIGTIANATALFLVSYILGQDSLFISPEWWGHLSAGFVFGILNAFLRPILSLISLPFIILTLGLFIFVINAGILYATEYFFSSIIPGFGVLFVVSGGFWNYVIVAFFLGIVNWIIQLLFSR